MRRVVLLIGITVTFFSMGPSNVQSQEIKDGLHKTYYASGAVLSEETYKNGKPYHTREYSEDGQLIKTMQYKDGVLSYEVLGSNDYDSHRTFKRYYKNGNVKTEFRRKNGSKDGFYREYDEKGTLRRDNFYRSGKKDGPQKAYRENGTLSGERIHDNGQLVGHNTYYENGKLSRETNYKTRPFQTKTYPEDGKMWGGSFGIFGLLIISILALVFIVCGLGVLLDIPDNFDRILGKIIEQRGLLDSIREFVIGAFVAYLIVTPIPVLLLGPRALGLFPQLLFIPLYVAVNCIFYLVSSFPDSSTYLARAWPLVLLTPLFVAALFVVSATIEVKRQRFVYALLLVIWCFFVGVYSLMTGLFVN